MMSAAKRRADEPRRRHLEVVPVAGQAVRPGGGDRHQRAQGPRGVLRAQLLLARDGGALERRPLLRVEQARHDVHHARRVEDVHRRPAVLRRDLHGRVLPARRGAADEERHLHPAPLHLAGHEHHLVERRRDEAAQARRSRPARRPRCPGSSRPAPSRPGPRPGSCCSPARRRRCSSRCRGRRPSRWRGRPCPAPARRRPCALFSSSMNGSR